MRADAAENVARHIDRGLMREVIDHERNVYHVMEVVHTLPLRIGMRNMLTAVTSPERAFYEAVVQKTIDQIMDIEHETRGQSKVPRWHKERLLRIASSCAHRIKTREGEFESFRRFPPDSTTFFFCSHLLR
ncbi:hypothetical protein HPB50_000362 [Hyalomma asiaticum]|uniref:Uncharacterized protein n=1 Tax=Hyalomma asiaticum TaxID=266040 RepID=A0ACB7SCW9_HYAAI|nr:hypothetical protein HPB50_000362 [Hyalomma asiaticum]